MKHRTWSTVVFVAFYLGLASPAAALTAEEAQSLPEPELAQRVLGESGKIMIDVDRPTWGWRAPSIGYPPLESLTFYSVPVQIYSQFMGPVRFTGVCEASRTSVYFDGTGSVIRLENQNRYDVGLDSNCGAGGTTRNYFPAPNWESAKTIGQYFSIIQKAIAAPGQLPFALTCPHTANACGPARDALRAARLGDFSEARAVDCAPGQNVVPDRRECYELSYGVTFITIDGQTGPSGGAVKAVSYENRIGPH